MRIISILYLQGDQISYLYHSRHSLTRRLPLSTRCLEDFLLAYLAPVEGQTCSPTHLRMSIHHLTRHLCLSTRCLKDFLLAYLASVRKQTCSPTHLRMSIHHLTRRLCL